MTYQEAINLLYSQAPMFQNLGQKAYKTGLENSHFLDKYFGFPHKKYKTIHVGGTNGKGSVSHLLASVLQEAGYKVGLYTSPHLKDFRERIRVNGEMISQEKVTAFIVDNQRLIQEINPSFFEITTALAFLHFAQEDVDIAVIEVGLGGRLDCTNIISPILSIITNVSLDHTNILGETVEKIASEKAGIIKPKTPVVVGEYQNEKIKEIFLKFVKKNDAILTFAQEENSEIPKCELKGFYQEKNCKTVISTLKILTNLGLNVKKSSIDLGFKNVIKNTHLQGRWQQLSDKPKIICDTGHNEGGIRYIAHQISVQKYKTLRMVIGMVGDKDVEKVLSLLPKTAVYYFTQASIPRALNVKILQEKASKFSLFGKTFETVKMALEQAKKDADEDDFIFIGGSTFVVAEII